MKQLKEESELVGKTILRVKSSDAYTAIFFTDNTFCIIISHGGGEFQNECFIDDDDFNLNPKTGNLWLLHDLSFITKEEYDYFHKIISEESKEKTRQYEIAKLKELMNKYPEAT